LFCHKPFFLAFVRLFPFLFSPSFPCHNPHQIHFIPCPSTGVLQLWNAVIDIASTAFIALSQKIRQNSGIGICTPLPEPGSPADFPSRDIFFSRFVDCYEILIHFLFMPPFFLWLLFYFAKPCFDTSFSAH
jgi:hypothetical protein